MADIGDCTARAGRETLLCQRRWQSRSVGGHCEYQPAERGCPTRFQLTVRLPEGLGEEQVSRLMQIAAKCPVHRTLDGEVMFEDQIELVEPATT